MKVLLSKLRLKVEPDLCPGHSKAHAFCCMFLMRAAQRGSTCRTTWPTGPQSWGRQSQTRAAMTELQAFSPGGPQSFRPDFKSSTRSYASSLFTILYLRRPAPKGTSTLVYQRETCFQHTDAHSIQGMFFNWIPAADQHAR